jgi:hypothetical protein
MAPLTRNATSLSQRAKDLLLDKRYQKGSKLDYYQYYSCYFSWIDNKKWNQRLVLAEFVAHAAEIA